MKQPTLNLLESISLLIEKSIPVLAKHPAAWWRLVAIVLALAVAGAIYSLSTRLEPNKAIEAISRPSGMKSIMDEARDDCWVRDGQFVDREGKCW